ncbi:S8/S53 family peptidase [Azospirillum sp. A26]|uniref:S8 family serine peptidase n=1 Tax=Azospirillum sp. A26 TaxID=3160607 RepID=UPI00366D2056
MGLELLKAAAAAVEGSQDDRLTQGILRFSLEYGSPPEPGAERVRIATLLQSSGFAFYPLPPGDDPAIFVLDFKGVSRVQSARYLFEQAHELADALQLVSCTPDVDPGWRTDVESDPSAPESVRTAVERSCRSPAPAPEDALWATKAVGADEAWAAFETRGEGIRIGQPDTGVTDHPELQGAVDIGNGIDVIAGEGPPLDPLGSHMRSPGHGTATSSCVASRPAGGVLGSAPGATVVPIRCIDNVVIGSGAAVAAAIDHARRTGCHIVSLSLGGPLPFPDLKRAIARAVEAGMIVLAAAGNCVRIVVYPAWDENVIAVAGVDVHDRPWKGTSRGGKVDVSAPAENVAVARRTTPAPEDPALVEPGQGTSFATAITAGCAALWLARHTVEAVTREAASRGTTVQALFRAALRQTARRPPAGWDEEAMGTGVVNAERLLALPLAEIQLPSAPAVAAHPAADIRAPGLPWDRFSAEAGYLAFDKALRLAPDHTPALESVVPARPSSALAEAMRRSGQSPERLAAPAVLSMPIPPDIEPAAALRVIASRRPGGMESAGAIGEAQARDILRGSGKQLLLENAEKMLGATARPPSAVIATLRQEVLGAMPGVLDGFIGGVSSTRSFSGIKRVAAEALIRLTGRPALRVDANGFVDLDSPRMDSWGPDLTVRRHGIKAIIAATGRIDMTVDGVSSHVGTGTVVGPGLVMTNRHVIDAFAEPLPRPGGGHDFKLTAPVTINFDPAAQAADRCFTVEGVVAAGPDRIGEYVDVRKLDMALLAVSATSATGNAALPAAVKLAGFPDLGNPARNIVVVGYPAKPNYAAGIDPATGQQSLDIWDRLWELYGEDYGFKYISPGEVERKPGELPEDLRAWAFGHDATTLWGNSGSCILSLTGDGDTVCGLHFGGAPKRVNMAHDLWAVRLVATGGGPAGGGIDGEIVEGLNWVDRG